jgi:hypothetical protein
MDLPLYLKAILHLLERLLEEIDQRIGGYGVESGSVRDQDYFALLSEREEVVQLMEDVKAEIGQFDSDQN